MSSIPNTISATPAGPARLVIATRKSRLALWQLLEEKHDPSALSVLDALKAEAKAHGFKRILQLIDARTS